MAAGNDPGENFNQIVAHTFRESGPEDFCFGEVTFLSNLDLSVGNNATLQVISGGSEGGLYAVTFVKDSLSSSEVDQHCKNSTGVKIAMLEDDSINANDTNSINPPAVSSGGSRGTASETAAASSLSSTSIANIATATLWAPTAMGVLGGSIVL